jgi:tetratricopeptide (TPR) repeat protein
MVKVDTALATADFFSRLSSAFSADSQPQKAQEAASRGVQKFADNAGLWQAKADAERKAGQSQQAIESQRKALALDGKIENGYLQIAQIFNDLNMPDSSVAAVRQGVGAGNSKEAAWGLMMQISDKARRGAASSKKLDEFRAAGRLIAFTDSIAPAERKPNVAFLAGANNLQFGAQALTEARESKNCELIKEAQAALTDSQAQIMLGGKTNPTVSGQLMGTLGQVMPFGEQLAKAICK